MESQATSLRTWVNLQDKETKANIHLKAMYIIKLINMPHTLYNYNFRVVTTWFYKLISLIPC